MTKIKDETLSRIGAPKKLSRRTALQGASAAAVSFGLPFATMTTASQAALAPIRLGYQFHLWGAPAVVAVRKGYFRDEGLEVTDRKFASGKDTRDAMIAGSVDIGTVGITPFIVGATRGSMVAIATVCYAGKTGLVMAKPGIKTVADLKGKRIASQVGSTLDSVFKNAIAPAAGLKKGDYTILNARFADHVQALASGSVDAFLGLEPFCSIAEAQGIAVVVTDYYKYDLIPNMLAVNTSYLDAHPDTCLAFLRGWMKAVKLFKDDPAAANEIMLSVYSGRNYNISPKIISNALSRLIVNPEFIPELPGYIVNQAKALVKSGRLDKVPDPNKILRRDLLQKVTKG
jgi:ABC-type nitrate/sulfonate/bicarbonate transport system substrate-binding protein